MNSDPCHDKVSLECVLVNTKGHVSHMFFYLKNPEQEDLYRKKGY
jgi:hypothetical protein